MSEDFYLHLNYETGVGSLVQISSENPLDGSIWLKFIDNPEGGISLYLKTNGSLVAFSKELATTMLKQNNRIIKSIEQTNKTIEKHLSKGKKSGKSRYFAPISEEDLKAKIDKVMEDQNPYNLVEKLEKDMKVQFDLENYSCGSKGDHDYGLKKLLGLRTLDNGFTFHGFCAGGDWEHPVFFIVYFDGKKLRGYIPTDGNTWNTTTKQAYGNNEEDDYENAMERYPQYFQGEEEDYPESFEDIGVTFNEDEMEADIKDRIQPAK